MVRIAAVADVHSPKYLKEFEDALSGIQKPDLFLFAGDMVNFGAATEYRNIIKTIDKSIGEEIPILACFGNEEHRERREHILSLVGTSVQFLEEERSIIEVKGKRIGIVGAAFPISSRDKLENASVGIRDVFESRVRKLSQLLDEVTEVSDYSILLVHYSPLFETTSDDKDSFSWWISEAIHESQPDLVIHGHIHNPYKRKIIIGKTVVINVAFPNHQEVTEFVLHDNDFH
ncbi:MAG: metallophosphoesterase [Candidatus Thorarchaeota archaeon]